MTIRVAVCACVALADLNGSLFKVTPPGVASGFLYTFAGTNTWTVVAVDRAGNSSGVSNPATLTVQLDQSLC